MSKLGDALKERYFSSKHHYGLKDEGNTMQVLRSNITSQLGRYQRNFVRKNSDANKAEGAAEAIPANPLAAVFALAEKKKKEEEAKRRVENGEDKEEGELNLKVMKSMKRGKLQPND